MRGAHSRLRLNSNSHHGFNLSPENHVGVELPASVGGTGGGVRPQGAGLQVGHVGHQVEVVSPGHAAQLLENL